MTRTPHVSVYIGESQIWVYRSEGFGRPAAEFCSPAGVSVHEDLLVCSGDNPDDNPDGEPFPFRYIDDPTILVGSQLLPAKAVFECIMGAALAGVGVSEHAIANVVEVGFPTHWGSSRRSVVRDSLRNLCREVSFVADAVAAVLAMGERASGKSVVVELSGLTANITHVDRSPTSTRLGPCVRFPDVGTHDTLSVPSNVGRLMDRAHEISTGLSADLIVLTTNTVVPAQEPAHSAASSHSVSGRDVVRGLATGTVASLPVDSTHVGVRATSPSIGLPGPDSTPAESLVVLGRDDGPSRYRMPVRSAQWLSASVEAPPRRHGRVRLYVIAASVCAVGAVIAGAMWSTGSDPSSVAGQSNMQQSNMHQSIAQQSSTRQEPPPTVTTTTAATPTSVPVLFNRDRVSVRLPSGWRIEDNAIRMELRPQGGEAMKIVVVTTPLRQGAQLAEAVDSIERQLASRDGDGTFADFDGSVDFGNRTGASYTETPTDGTVVHWKVFVDQGLQVSVGCQFAVASGDAIGEPCAVVVDSVAVTSG